MTKPARGAVLGIAAAALFGASTPLAKHLVGEVQPQLLAGLLYAGAAMVLSAVRILRTSPKEAHLRRSDAPAVVAVTFFGGVVAPVLLLIGLERVSGVAGSLLLNLEAVFTMALALIVFGEHLDRRAAGGGATVVAAAAVLGLGSGASRADWIGIACIGLACMCWAIDNNLTQRLSGRDPFAVVRVKATVAGSVNLALAIGLGVTPPPAMIIVAALMLGGAAYGLSVVLDAYALRFVGAAREAAYFGTAPFFGVLISVLVLNETINLSDGIAMAVMAVGVYLLITESHRHHHRHDPLDHDHRHRHNDGHHNHRHAQPITEHSHRHLHEPMRHAHPHVSDVHHRHSHAQVPPGPDGR